MTATNRHNIIQFSPILLNFDGILNFMLIAVKTVILMLLIIDSRGVSNGVSLKLGHAPFVKLLSLIALRSDKKTIETKLLACARDIWNMFISIQHSVLTTKTLSSSYLLLSSALLHRKFGRKRVCLWIVPFHEIKNWAENTALGNAG